MPYRYIHIRTVDPNNKTVIHPFSLIRAALAAAEETIQGGPLVNSWLQLFQSHLSEQETDWLQWKDDLAVSAEMRRAYSAMYGRYFARGILTQKFGLENFVSLERNGRAIENGVTVSRTRKGDIPDWIAWDPFNNSYVLVEAKGILRGKDSIFLKGCPSCIEAGKKQFQRVSVKDRNNRLVRTRNWVAANLWSTDDHPHSPVSLLWDPEGYGEDLSDGEIQEHRVAIRKYRMAKLATGMGFSIQPNGKISGLNVEVSVKPKPDRIPPGRLEKDVLTYGHEFEFTRYEHEVDIEYREPHEGCLYHLTYHTYGNSPDRHQS